MFNCLMTLPGVDYTIAHALKATLADITRFPEPDKAASYLGLVPSVKQSAGKCYNGPITKAGSSQARWLLIQAAQSVSRHPGPLGAFFRKLEKRKNRNVAVVATARKMVTIAWHMLKNKEALSLCNASIHRRQALGAAGACHGSEAQGRQPQGNQSCLQAGDRGSRTIPSLDEVYDRQGMPSREPLAEGEKRMVRQSGTEPYVTSLDKREGRAQEVKVIWSGRIERRERQGSKLSSGSTGGFPLPPPPSPRPAKVRARRWRRREGAAGVRTRKRFEIRRATASRGLCSLTGHVASPTRSSRRAPAVLATRGNPAGLHFGKKVTSRLPRTEVGVRNHPGK